MVRVFDLFHIGHLDGIRLAADRCDGLIVGVADDDLVCEIRGVRPFVPETERRQIVSSLRCVARVVRVSDLDLRAQVSRHGIDVVFALEGDDVADRLVADTDASGADVQVPVVPAYPDVPAVPAFPVVRLSGARDTSSTAVRAALAGISSRSHVA